MSSRYFWISTILIVAVTAGISIVRRTRSRWEVFQIFLWVLGAMILVMALVLGLAKLLEVLGVAQSGFFL